MSKYTRERDAKMELMLNDYLLAGRTHKDFAQDAGVHHAWAYRHGKKMGWLPLYVLPAEWEQIMAQRKALLAVGNPLPSC